MLGSAVTQLPGMLLQHTCIAWGCCPHSTLHFHSHSKSADCWGLQPSHLLQKEAEHAWFWVLCAFLKRVQVFLPMSAGFAPECSSALCDLWSSWSSTSRNQMKATLSPTASLAVVILTPFPSSLLCLSKAGPLILVLGR